MNTATGYTRVNLTIPKDIIAYLKRHTENMSNYLRRGHKSTEAEINAKAALRS